MAQAFPQGPGAYGAGQGPAFTPVADQGPKPMSDFGLMASSGGFLKGSELKKAREQLERIKAHAAKLGT